jgi:hypothetical protein
MLNMMNMRRGIYPARVGNAQHKYWRLRIIDTLDPNAVAASKTAGFSLIQFRQVPLQNVTMTTQGSPSSTGNLSASYTPDLALNTNNADGWAAPAGAYVGAAWQFTYTAKQIVTQVAMKSWSTAAESARMPRSWTLEWSDISLTAGWHILRTFTDNSSWANAEVRTYDV